jgi:hypothetical protein
MRLSIELALCVALLGACGRLGYGDLGVDGSVDNFDANVPANDTGTSGDTGTLDVGPATGDFTLTSPTRVVNRLDEARFSGTCAGGIALTGAQSATVACTGGIFEVVVTASTDGSRSYLLSPLTGSDAPITVVWIRDHSLPRVTRLALESGAAVSLDPTLNVLLYGDDDLSNIISFCLDWRTRAAPPAADDPCFVPVAAPSPGLVPAPSLRIENYEYRVGFGAATYVVRAWVLDEAGNVSELGNAGTGVDDVDRDSIEYRPGLAPVLTDVWAANTRTPAAPIPVSALVVDNGTPVYIGWNAVDDEALPPTPISIYYTTDEMTFVPIAMGLANGSNAGCTVNSPGTSIDDRATGCFVWTSSLAAPSYARLRVIAEDSIGQRSATSASPFNLPNMRILAGNFDPGTDASGRAAVFAGASAVGVGGVGGIVVARDGTIYFRDVVRGILMIEPEDGVQRVLVPMGPSSTGDGGPVALATVRMPHRLALDHRDRLLVFDHDRIRRIDLLDPQRRIDTLIGGGSSTADTAPAREVAIAPPPSVFPTVEMARTPFFALPSGDILFESGAYGAAPVDGGRFRRYRAATGMVETIRVSGVDDALNPGQDVGRCEVMVLGVTYDLVTSAISYAQAVAWADNVSPACPAPTRASAFVSLDMNTGTVLGPGPTGRPSLGPYWATLTYPVQGMDGRLYAFSRAPARIYRVDVASQSFVPIAGTDVTGRCPDGTPALMCNINPIELFVDAQGQVYFLDSDTIRVIDETGAVRTILGQRLDFGDGQAPSSARFAKIPQLATWTDGSGASRIVVTDPAALRIREIRVGLDVQTLAGNGANAIPAPGALARTSPLFVFNFGRSFHGFTVEANGTVWMGRGANAIASFDRATGTWVDRMGGGTQSFFDPASDGVIGSSIDLAPPGPIHHFPQVLGVRTGAVLTHKSVIDSTGTLLDEALIFEAATSNGALNRVLGAAGRAASAACADGTAVDSCAVGFSELSAPAEWDAVGARWLWTTIGSSSIRTITSTSIGTLANVDAPINGFTYQSGVVHACGTDGVLRRLVVGMTPTTVPLPPQMRCAGGIRYAPDRASIVFSFEWNGLGGVAELLSL